MDDLSIINAIIVIDNNDIAVERQVDVPGVDIVGTNAPAQLPGGIADGDHDRVVKNAG